jgi:FKBP-type peptidyl-prolyl cis-trans isomerase FklB
MNKKILASIVLASFVLHFSPVWAESELKTEKQKLSYAMGIYFSQSVVQQKADLDIDAFTQAINDVLTNADLKMTQQEIQTVLSNYQQQLVSERDAAAGGNKTKGKIFLEENKKKEGVVELKSGLQYKIVKQGDGGKPAKDSSVKVHYHGTLINGKVFDSSYDRGEPVTLSLNQVIKGWQEIVPMMNVGSKWQIFVPSDLAYGDRGAGGSIGPNETLIFDIELLAIN